MAFIERKVSGGGGGKFFKWDVIGKQFAGKYVRLGAGSYKGRDTSHAVFIEDGTGAEVKVNAPAMLRRVLEQEFKPGARLLITYTHDEKGSNPQPTKIFKFHEWEEGANASLPTNQPAPTGVPPLLAALAQAQQAQQPQPPATPAVDEVDRLTALLSEKVGSGNMPIIAKMLNDMPDAASRIAALKDSLRAYGITA